MHSLFASFSLCLAGAIAACSPTSDSGNEDGNGESSALLGDAPETVSSSIRGDAIPEGIRAAAEARIPGMTIDEVEKKEREGNTFFDVEGARPDGSEVELDMLQGEDGSFTVVEVQRDLDWSDVPENARAAADNVEGMFTPVRVIESIQNDGTVIYELFADGKPEAPSAEVSVKDGEAEMLTERWEY